MSSLLTLHAPVPHDFLFERTFMGEYETLIRMSRLRGAAGRAARTLNESGGDQVSALDEYAQAWRSFVATHVYDRGASARTRLPFEVSWQVSIFGSDAVTYSHAEPVFETACSTLALVAALQRRGGAASGSVSDLQRARDELSYLRDKVLAPLYLARASDEPPVLSRVLADAMDDAIAGQATVKAAVASMQAATATATHLASAMFDASSSFARASARLPTRAVLAASETSTRALALRYTAEAVLESVVAGASPNEAQGVAVTLARRAHATDRANAAVERYMTEVNRRNVLEFASQIVPSSSSVHVVRTPQATEVRCARHEHGWRVEMP
jgi:hypothetical protein